MNDPAGRKIDYLRLSVTDRCNLRCLYCMPETGVPMVAHSDLLSFEEIERLAWIFRRLGISKLRITGGEPLLRRDLTSLVSRLAAMDFEELVLTTNGLLLAPLAGGLASAGLHRVNVSLDSTRNEVLAAIARGRITREEVERAILAAKDAGLGPVRVNCVVLKGLNDREVPDFILWAYDMGVEPRFIECMPSGFTGAMTVTAAEILRAASVLGEPVRIGGVLGEVQETWRIEGTDLSFGLIAPLSDGGFCSRCRRLRLSATGQLFPCLDDVRFFDLRKALRDGAGDTDTEDLVRSAIASKPLRHGGCSNARMWRTGG
ncbi:GTP 3',8-cyclase MoaA [Candidatus Fermentibacteria bacterium]|nr:GTP 3',8-cyclase MoaA [Candidatus Fermentibacteria bacterium]